MPDAPVEQNPPRISPIRAFLQIPVIKLAALIGIVSALAVPIYTYNIFLNAYLKNYCGFTNKESLQFLCYCLINISILVPVAGSLSDKIGHIRNFSLGCIFTACMGYGFFAALQNHFFIYPVSMVMGFAIAMIAAPIFAIINFEFPKYIRFTGVSFVFNTAMTLFGGTVPMICIWLCQKNVLYPGLYMAAASAVGLISITSLTGIKQYLPKATRPSII